MKIQAYGPMVSVKPIESHLQKEASKAGIVLEQDIKREGARTNFMQGTVQSFGHKVEDLNVGDTVIYNPFDIDEWDGHHLINAAAVVAKLV